MRGSVSQGKASQRSQRVSGLRARVRRWAPWLAAFVVAAVLGSRAPWIGLAAICGTVALGLLVWARRRALEVTSVTPEQATSADAAWDRLDADVRAAEETEVMREAVLRQYRRDAARARRRHRPGHPDRALAIALAVEAHHELDELETAALLGCELVESLAGAPLPLQMRAFTILASIERDADAPFGRAGLYGWVRQELATQSAVARAHWALTGGALAEDQGDLETAAHRYSEALELLEGPASGSPYRSKGVDADRDLVVEARTRLGAVLVRMGAFEAAYEIERELENQPLEPAVHRWIRRRMAHHAHNLGRYSEARQRLRSLIDSADSDSDRARLLAAMAVVERDAGALDEAHRAATSSYVLEVVQEVEPSSDAIAVLARIELERGRTTIAASLVDEVRCGVERLPHAGLMQVEALVAGLRGAEEHARTQAERAVALAMEEHGENHPFVTDAMHTLALILIRTGHRSAAAAVLSRAVDIVEARTGRQHPRLVRLLDALADVETDAGAAVQHRARIEEICSRHGVRAPVRA